MSTAIDKTLARVHIRVASHEYYEAHQAVRTVVARYVRQRDYGPAVGLLYTSALLLSRAGQTGSAGDLLLYMLKVYGDAGVPVDGSSKGRLAQVVWLLDPRDPLLKQLAQAAGKWAGRDADLAHVFGSQFARGGQAYEAEKYLLSGTPASAILLAELHSAWAAADAGASRSLYAARGVLGYLSTQNVRAALAYLHQFGETPGDLGEFLHLLVPTCQTRNRHLYKQLVAHYAPATGVPAAQPALAEIEQSVFGIVPQRQVNLMDLMGGFMK